jgi:hypothetical protein
VVELSQVRLDVLAIDALERIEIDEDDLASDVGRVHVTVEPIV